MNAEEMASLWLRYRSQRDPSAREQIILSFAPLVRYAAGRLAMGLPPQVDMDDLESYGLLGLIDAVERFDPQRGVKFETFALPRVRGAIIDGLRAETWAPGLRQKARQLEAAYGDLEVRLGRPPSDAELAAHLGISLEELYRREAAVGAVTVLSLDEVWPGHGEGEATRMIERLRDEHAADPLGSLLEEEKKSLLVRAIDRLPEKERLVVALFYFEGLTAKEVSQVMNLSLARISQLHSKAILRLRGSLSRAKQQLLS